MTNFTMSNNISFLNYVLKLANSLTLILLHIRHINETELHGVPHGDGDGPRTPPRWLEGVWKKFQMTNNTTPNNFSFMKYAEKSVPGLADVGVPHGDGDGPRTPPRWLEGAWRKFQMPNLTMPNHFSSMEYAEKSVPGTADGGVPHGVEVKARFPGA